MKLKSRLIIIFILLMIVINLNSISRAQFSAGVTVWVQDTGPLSDNIIQALVETAETEFDTVIDIVVIPSSEFRDQFIVASLSGEGPDGIFATADTIMSSFRDLLIPISEDVIFSANIFQGSRQGFEDSDGQLLALPTGIFPMAVIYNQELLFETGFEIPFNISWDELLQLANEPGYPIVFEVTPYTLDSITASMGLQESILSLRGDMSPVAAQVDYYLSHPGFHTSFAVDITEDGFISGESAIIVGGLWNLSRFSSLGANFTRFPMLSPDNQDVVGPGFGWAISSSAWNPPLLSQIFERTNSHPAMVQAIVSMGALPAYESGFEIWSRDPGLADGFLSELVLDNIDNLRQIAETTRIRPAPANIDVGTYSYVTDVVLTSLIDDGVPFLDILDEIQPVIENAQQQSR